MLKQEIVSCKYIKATSWILQNDIASLLLLSPPAEHVPMIILVISFILLVAHCKYYIAGMDVFAFIAENFR